MRQIDRRTVESHLSDAVQHLATAGVVCRHLERAAELTREDRIRLMQGIAEVQAMIDDVTGTLSGRTIDLRLLELLRQSQEDE